MVMPPMSQAERDETVAEVESAHAVAESHSPEAMSKFPELLTRISARFAMRVLEMVDFHHMDEDLSQGRLDPKFAGPIKRSVAMASPELFPQPLKPLASSLKEHLSALETALVHNDLESAKAQSHEAHEKYHELQHEISEWLGK